MKYLWLLFAFVTSAHANTVSNTQTVKFNFWDNHSFYACSYVERMSENFAKKLGATNISVDCDGGLPYHTWVSAEITFTTPEHSEPIVSKLRVNEACQFNKELIEKLLPAFSPTEVKRKGFCSDSNGKLRYTVTH